MCEGQIFLFLYMFMNLEPLLDVYEWQDLMLTWQQLAGAVDHLAVSGWLVGSDRVKLNKGRENHIQIGVWRLKHFFVPSRHQLIIFKFPFSGWLQLVIIFTYVIKLILLWPNLKVWWRSPEMLRSSFPSLKLSSF